MNYYLYILECINDAFYTGYTTDIGRRYQEHRKGTSKCKYTRSFPPRRLAACWKVSLNLSEVLRLEKTIKQQPKKAKLALILQPSSLSSLFSTEDNRQYFIDSIVAENTASLANIMKNG